MENSTKYIASIKDEIRKTLLQSDKYDEKVNNE